LANFLNLLSISNYTFGKVILQSYLLGVDAAIILIVVLRGRILKKNINSNNENRKLIK